MLKTMTGIALSILRNFADERLRAENERLRLEVNASRELDLFLRRARAERYAS